MRVSTCHGISSNFAGTIGVDWSTIGRFGQIRVIVITLSKHASCRSLNNRLLTPHCPSASYKIAVARTFTSIYSSECATDRRSSTIPATWTHDVTLYFLIVSMSFSLSRGYHHGRCAMKTHWKHTWLHTFSRWQHSLSFLHWLRFRSWKYRKRQPWRVLPW